MKVTLNQSGHPKAYGTCIVEREPGDPYFYTDSVMMYHMKQELNKQGYDLIKKRMWRDGHLVDDRQQYLRSRNVKAKNLIMIWWPHYSVRNAFPDFNSGEYTVKFFFDGETINNNQKEVTDGQK